jgi:D-3-phosphoglycerate dehydrogenase
MSLPYRTFVIGDGLQRADLTARILTQELAGRVSVDAVEWDTSDLGGMSDAAMGAERGLSYPVPIEWHDRLAQCQILVTHFFPIRAEVLRLAERVKIIASLRHGLENVDEKLAREQGIEVINNPGRTAEPVADWAVCAIIDLVRGYSRANSALHALQWPQPFEVAPRARDLRSITVGIVGFGYVGQAVSKRLAAFGCRLLVHDPYASGRVVATHGAVTVGLDTLLSQSDVVTLHVRLTPETRGMIGARELDLLQAGGLLVNAARAELVDEQALISALSSGRLGGAALDVFWSEPLGAEHPLRRLDNAVLTPHLAGSTVNSEETSAVRLAARLQPRLGSWDGG